MNQPLCHKYFKLLLLNALFVDGANWAQFAGERAQNTATPYIPDKWHREKGTSIRPMWSARWGHAVVVLDQSIARSYLTEEENSEFARDANPVLVLLGGDDGLPRDIKNMTTARESGIGSGKLRNDVWIGELSSRSQAPWRVDDRYFVEGRVLNPELIRSEMRWHVVNPGRVAPASWPSDSQHTIPLTHDEWIVCQDSLKHKLPNPSICIEPSQTCRADIMSPGCHAQAVWKKDNMWSPRRGHGAAVANNNIFVIGGQAREYARIDDSRLVRGIDGQRRVDTLRDFSTIREDIVLKNDIWISNDGKGESWKLVNPGCKDPQQEVLMQTEVWSRDLSDPNLPKIIGSLGSKCYRSSDCYGIAECKALGNTSEMVCVCPMFGPREHHTVAVQHRFSIQEDNSTFAEDVIYVVGGFTSVKQAFCSNRSCGPTDGYRLAIDDAWMSSDGVNWFQFKPAFSTRSSFVGRGSHTALVVQATFQKDIAKSDQRDRLIILGGESLNPKELNTTHLHDVWQVYLPTEPCCIPDKGCIDKSKVQDVACLPRHSDWMAVTQNAEWPERSSHTSVYEPPSPINSFQHSIYLMGGKNSAQVFSDVWRWGLENDESWHCDFCGASPPVEKKNSTTTASLTYDAYLDIRSPLTALQRFELPVLDNSGKLLNFTSHSHSLFVSDADLSVMASTGVTTIEELALADLYSILKLRGFDYPGRHAREVPNICYMRAISISFVGKCAIKDYPDSFFHTKSVRRIGQPVIERPSELCGRGGDTKPCVASDWDGCTPIPGVSAVDVHGLGDVAVPQTEHNTSHVMEEMFCRQVPGDRYLGASAFLDNKVVVLGGMANNGTHLYRDVWSRDEVFPHAIITTKPESQSPQSTFFFDSNEAGAHVFEYKILRDGVDIIPWTVTTKTLGVDVSWLDDKKGGPGKGWYTLFVRSVDPSGNKDNRFSTQTNVYKWYYVPPIPWGAVSGCILAFLVLVLGGYYEYRRRKRKATLQRFALRRMRRKFKLKSVNQELNEEIFQGNIVSNLHRRRNSEVTDHFSNSRMSSRKSGHASSRHREDGDRRRRHRSHSRTRSKSRSRSHQEDRNMSGARQRRKKKISAEDEARNRKRRDREKNRRHNLRHYDEEKRS